MRISDKVILVDCDGVLMDWRYGFASYMYEEYGFEMVNHEQADYDISIMYPDFSKSTVYEYIEVFNTTEAMKSLPPHKDAIYYVRKLHEEHGYVFHMITAQNTLGQNDQYFDNQVHLAREWRKENTRNLFGETAFEKFHFTHNGDKTEFLERYENTGCIWIEDHLDNAELGLNLGLDALLMDHTYNRNNREGIEPFVPVMKNWKEIYHYIVGE